jgi:hypothetical protein
METTTWYEYNTTFAKIKTVEVERFSDKFVIINGRRHNRESSYYGYCPDKDSAKQALIDYFSVKIKNAKQQVEYHEEQLKKALSL